MGGGIDGNSGAARECFEDVKSLMLGQPTVTRSLTDKNQSQARPEEPRERELNLNETLEMRPNDVATVPQSFHRERLTLGLGWSTHRQGLDLDASCLFLDSSNNCSEKWTLFFNNKKLPGAVHSGDNRTGHGAGDDEQIHITLNKVPDHIHHLAFVVNIYSDNRSFAEVNNSYIRMVGKNDHVMARFNLDASVTSRGVLFAVFSRRGRRDWCFKAVGGGIDGNSGAAPECFADVKSLMLGQPTSTANIVSSQRGEEQESKAHDQHHRQHSRHHSGRRR